MNETEALSGYTYIADGFVNQVHVANINVSFPTRELDAFKMEAAEEREREEAAAAAALDAEAVDGFMTKVILGVVFIVAVFANLMYRAGVGVWGRGERGEGRREWRDLKKKQSLYLLTTCASTSVVCQP